MWTQENPVIEAARAARPLSTFWDAVLACLSRVRIRRKPQALRLAETLPLGERRMLAIVEWRGETLLIGVTPQHINLLQAKGNWPPENLPAEEELAR